MVVGFNHNFRYKGEVYHIQTEDSGVKSPNIVTLLYQGGTILGSKKTSYADIAKVDNLEQVVEELMKEQHKGMLRSLKTGEYDEVIDRFQAGKKVVPKEVKVTAPEVVAPPASRPLEPVRPAASAAPSPLKPAPVVPEPAPVTPVVVPAVPAATPVAVDKKHASPAVETSLDEVILSYLMGDD
ncbi:hypothetical protein P9J64_11625 [Deltaproteobacteria bacterium IMCC39524]|nr:hypothetical protein [Deltaproteobacteria bacterium IMCC39524]